MAQGQRNVSVVFDVEPKLVYPDWSHVHVIRMNLEIMVILGILVCFLYQLRKLVNKSYRWANPPAAGVDNLDGTSGHQVRNLNPSTPEPETNAVQPRHKDASTQTQLSPNAANDGNVADAEAKKKLEDTAGCRRLAILCQDPDPVLGLTHLRGRGVVGRCQHERP